MATRFWGCRHGESLANVRHLITSSPASEAGVGLTEKGRLQAREAARTIIEKIGGPPMVVCSPFLRARQTAEEITETLGLPEAECLPAFRERYFGRFDGHPSDGYLPVWERDRLWPGQALDDVESISAVVGRMRQALQELAKRFPDGDVVIVSHGDPLLIIQNALAGRPIHLFRDMTEFANGEIRRLV